ncbi:hypothetical protein J3B02_001936 [Coemansia erecta]|uniref:Saccharopine dehydrogenase NADP binding domain-containing protein n=1 Tax=Coemansia asiatica TaxID=1052880 RepID=A0A9W8CMG3_9FUNG|nr:hypothetical protein LPJ64_000306 [Coemansia asiatica]KAJ2855867.1 hypothetical protein J3B02_001936 [Coemansia erecta]
MSLSRKYDIVIWGASSFTGARLVEYLALNAPTDARIAIGGRNKTKLAEVQSRLAAKHVSAADALKAMDILVGDSTDAACMHEIALQTRVVASTVGPYTRFGTELVRACVEAKTDYCDITGEMPWVREMHCELNDLAVENNVHVASFCGFDCIPADLGCMMLAQYAHEELHEPLLHVKGSIVGIRGGVSGGTLATLRDQLHTEKKMIFKSLFSSSGSTEGSANKRFATRGLIHFDKTLQRWQTFWIMSMINSQTANWAGQVLNYGPGFEYSESMSARSLLHAVAIAVGLFYGVLLMFFSVTRHALYALKIIPRPGEGPSEKFTERGFFSLNLEASTENHVFYGKVAGSSDPGYGETIKYLGESALCLAFDRDETFRPGVYPPSVVMGSALLRRLRNKGCQFEVSRKPIAALESTKKWL